MENNCNCSKSFGTGEYPCYQPACFKKKQPDCTATAVIPSITVENKEGITNLSNCLVHVINTNTTYYIDDKHRPMLIWAGIVEVPTLDQARTLGLRQQICYTSINDVYTEVYFDKSGNYHIMSEEA